MQNLNLLQLFAKGLIFYNIYPFSTNFPIFYNSKNSSTFFEIHNTSAIFYVLQRQMLPLLWSEPRHAYPAL